MTESPIVVRPTTDMTSAARLLLDTKVGPANVVLHFLHVLQQHLKHAGTAYILEPGISCGDPKSY